jgi:REP element-mobilizing transposase RayT
MRRLAQKYAVRVYEFANAGTHVHLLVRAKCRLALQNFLRTFAGITARLVTGARRGHPVGKFWDTLAYSRIVQWGREFFRVRAYVVQNELETLKYIPYQKRTSKRKGRERTEARQLE